ncbi:hypothetical protein LCGC14_2653930 [marine sediment metagenome]|uniref:Uncharacterized protein n=1 Tax=marine sediment metagenome TaxID=412755 RepID=A0A0F9AGA5_9ZZZZ
MEKDYLPIVAGEWIGNSLQVAAKHYLQVTEDDYAKALQNPVQYTAESARMGSQAEPAGETELAFCGGLRNEAAPCENTEPLNVGRTGPPRGLRGASAP